MTPLRRAAIRAIQPFTAARAARLCPERVIFFHIPKTAGSTVNAHFKGLLGSSWGGQALTISDSSGPEELALARRARFVGGHYGTAQLDHLGPGLRVTVLRDPMDRLVSAWRYQQTLKRPLPFETLEEALASGHPRVARLFDNAQARRLASPSGTSETPRETWLSGAKSTLSGFDVVLRQSNFDAEFGAFLRRLGLHAPANIGRANATGSIGQRPPPPMPDRAALASLAEPFIAIDRALLDSLRP
ncbi:MAG: sulfotransferase family 2 domain-containing protein [Pseudomonadota bacterium]